MQTQLLLHNECLSFWSENTFFISALWLFLFNGIAPESPEQWEHRTLLAMQDRRRVRRQGGKREQLWTTQKRENGIYCCGLDVRNVWWEGRNTDRARGNRSICTDMWHERLRGKKRVKAGCLWWIWGKSLGLSGWDAERFFHFSWEETWPAATSSHSFEW